MHKTNIEHHSNQGKQNGALALAGQECFDDPHSAVLAMRKGYKLHVSVL